MMKWNSKTLREELERLDPKLVPGEPDYQASLMLLASCVVGPSIRKIERLLRVQPGSLRKFAQRARANGIWRSGKITSDWSAQNGEGVVAFWLDVNVCLGRLRRR